MIASGSSVRPGAGTQSTSHAPAAGRYNWARSAGLHNHYALSLSGRARRPAASASHGRPPSLSPAAAAAAALTVTGRNPPGRRGQCSGIIAAATPTRDYLNAQATGA